LPLVIYNLRNSVKIKKIFGGERARSMSQKYESNLIIYLQGTAFVRVCQTRYQHDPLNETNAMEASGGTE